MISKINCGHLLLGFNRQGIIINRFLSVRTSVQSILYNRATQHIIPLGKIASDDLLNKKPVSSVLNYCVYKYSSSNTYNDKFERVKGRNGFQNFPQCTNNAIFAKTSLFTHNHNIITNIKRFSSSYEPVHSVAAYNTGIFKTISESAIVEFVQNLLITIHSTTGLPWWATIILSTVAMRATISLPLSLYQLHINAKVENLRDEMIEIVERLKKEANYAVRTSKQTIFQAKMAYKLSARKKWNELIVRENCHPMKGLILTLVQIPLWLSFTFALRNICFMLPRNNEAAIQTFLEFTTGGFGWITNLTDIDHTYVLPIVCAICHLIVIEIHSMQLKEPTTFKKFVLNFHRFFSIFLIPIMAYLPSGVTLYWTTSSMCTLSQYLLLLSPKVRRLGGVPRTDVELQHPYKELRDKLTSRFIFEAKKCKRKQGIHD